MTWSTIEGGVMMLALAVALHRGAWRLGAMLAALIAMQGARAFVLVPASRVDIFVQAGAWPAVLVAGACWTLRRDARVALPFVVYGVALALYGRLLAPWWPAPLMAPQVAAGAVAMALWLRKDEGPTAVARGPSAPAVSTRICFRPGMGSAPAPTEPALGYRPAERSHRLTLAQAAALLLPLSSLVDAVTVFAGAPSPVRAVLGVATYAAVGGMVAPCRSAG